MKRRRINDQSPMLFPEIESNAVDAAQSQFDRDWEVFLSWESDGHDSLDGAMDLRDDEPEIGDAEMTTGIGG